MISDSFLHSGDDAKMMSQLQHYCISACQCSDIRCEREVGLSVGTSMVLAPECSLPFPRKCTS